MFRQTDDLRIQELRPLVSPAILMEDYPITEEISATVANGRDEIGRLLDGSDDRLLVVVGPCSIHDPEAALDYARRLAHKRRDLVRDLCIVMRVYFEKPRTTVGWKGLITIRTSTTASRSTTACAPHGNSCSTSWPSGCRRAASSSIRSPRSSTRIW